MNGDLVAPEKDGYIYGITGGKAYVDSTTTEEDMWEGPQVVAGGLKGTVSGINEIVSSLGGSVGLDDSIINAVGTVDTILDKTTAAEANTVIDGDAGLHLQNYGQDWVRYYGAVGGDISVNTGLGGSIKVLGTTDILKKATETNIIRNVDVSNQIDSGSVIGGIGGSAAVTVGNIGATASLGTPPLSVDVDVTTNGKTSATINGSVTTTAEKDANVIGWMNGGAAAAIGGTAASTVTGNTTLNINGTDRADHQGDYEDSKNDAIPPITTMLNVMKGSKVNAIGVMGGGTAVSTLGGTAEAAVGGTSTVTVNDATVLGVVGGGAAASIDATDVGDVLADKVDPNHPPIGNDDGTTGFGINNGDDGLEIVTGPDEETATIKVHIDDINQGGTATSVTGDTFVNVTGDSTAAGILGGGIAAATHTYIGKIDKGAVIGASQASATTGKATITINMEEKLQESEKAAFVNSLSNLKNGIANDSTQADALADFANKGAVGAVFGGGASVAYGSVGTTGYAYDAENVKGAEAKSETAGADINLVNGYAAGVMGGGIAATRGNAYAESAMTDTVNINIGNFAETLTDNAEAVGVFGNGLAYYTGESDGGTRNLSGQAVVTAQDTNINVAGMADGLIGGGMAIDDSQSDTVNATVRTDGTAAINVYEGAQVNTVGLEALKGLVGEVPVDSIDMASYVDGVKAAAGDAAIAAGGIALGGGAESDVDNAVVNVYGGTVDGNVYGGGIAAYGYAGKDGAANGGSHVGTSTINLMAGGTVTGNVYAGGAVATKTSNGATVYGAYDKAAATVDEATVNLAGATVEGVLYGVGTVNQEASEAESVAVNSTLNLIRANTLTTVKSGEGAGATESSKIQKYDYVNATADSVTTVKDLTAGTGTVLIDGGKVTTEEGAKLDISALTKSNDAYHIAANTATDSTFWKDTDFVYDRTQGFADDTITTEGDKTAYDVTYKDVTSLTEEEKDKAAVSMAGALDAGPLAPTIRDGYGKNWDTANGLTEGGVKYFSDWSQNTDRNSEYGRGAMIGEDAAVTGNTASLARLMADNVMQRLSFTDDYVKDAGWVNEDGGIWAKYVHNKYETSGMGSSFGGIHSSSDYDGAIVGVDIAKNGNFQYGAAIHYGSGEGDGLISHNDYDAWGLALYASLKDEDAGTNLMADIGWLTTDNEIDGTVAGKSMSADRDVDAWTIGLRGEKEFVSGQNQLVTYVGLRYMSLNPGAYSVYYDGAKAFNADADNQNLWLLPIGVSFRNETVTGAGWRITPKLDLSYIWAFGDTDTDMNVDIGGVGSSLYYDVMDDNSWLASLGIEATKDVWSFGVGYGYQKGDDTKNKTWFVNASYAF